MLLKTISEVIWEVFQRGKPKADRQTFAEADILQMCKMCAANNFRQQYLFGQKIIPGKKILALPDEPETYFVSPLLSIKRFSLADANVVGMRRADMGEFDLYRLPKNAHFTNLYLLNTNCGGQQIPNTITQVKNGEEAFYLSPKFKSFLFYSVTGRGVNTYNVPPCVKNIDIETTYDSDTVDISLDICYDVLSEVLGQIFKTEDANGELQLKAREELKKREDIK